VRGRPEKTSYAGLPPSVTPVSHAVARPGGEEDPPNFAIATLEFFLARAGVARSVGLGGGAMTQFAGFPRSFFAFFRELKANNDRAWFEANKQRFREEVQGPMSDFIAAMAPHLGKLSKHFVADPRPNGGSMFRIYRDVRFSKDKRPYKEHAACQFRHRFGRDVHAPGFYVHLAHDEVFFGGGMWMPESDALLKIHQRIAERPADWKKVINDKRFVQTFGTIEGDQLTRPPKGFDPAHPLIADIRRKSFVAGVDSSAKAAQSPAFAEEVAQSFRALSPLMRFLCSALDVPY